MEQLATLKQQMISAVQGQMGNLQQVDCHELGEAIDMIKDLAEAEYYCTITEAMHAQEPERYYYTEPQIYYPQMPRDTTTTNRTGRMDYMGNSPRTRKMYMESKEMHHDKTVKMQELDKYMKELTSELVEMIEDSSPEEKQLLQNKLTALSNKIAQTNV